MSERKYKKQAFKILFAFGFSVGEARKKAYDLRNLSRDLKTFENENMVDSCAKLGIISN